MHWYVVTTNQSVFFFLSFLHFPWFNIRKRVARTYFSIFRNNENGTITVSHLPKPFRDVITAFVAKLSYCEVFPWLIQVICLRLELCWFKWDLNIKAHKTCRLTWRNTKRCTIDLILMHSCKITTRITKTVAKWLATSSAGLVCLNNFLHDRRFVD